MKVHFTANEAGARTIRFRIPPQQGEEITQNNVREVLLDVQDRKEKILFFDGEPHFEVKFIRRAVADDPNLQLVLLQRTTGHEILPRHDRQRRRAGGRVSRRRATSCSPTAA